MSRNMDTFDEKIAFVKKKFQELQSPSEKYHLLIELGKKLPPFDSKHKTEEFLVRGCQSQLFLRAEKKGDLMYFSATSDALISAGLAALLIHVYSGETCDTILKMPPIFLQELGIYASLSPNRSNGLSQIYLKMKMCAILLAHES